jgi:hypothetical protein
MRESLANPLNFFTKHTNFYLVLKIVFKPSQKKKKKKEKKLVFKRSLQRFD